MSGDGPTYGSRKLTTGPLSRAILRFLAGEVENGFGTDYGYLVCRCGHVEKVPLGAEEIWVYAHNREAHWEYEDPWTTALYMGVTYTGVHRALPAAGG